MKKWVLILLAGAAMVLVLVAWNKPLFPSGTSPSKLAEATSVPQRKITAEGSVVPELHSKLSVRITGRVAEIPAKVGAQVNAGQPLVKLDTEELEAQVAVAEAGLALAEAQLAQMREGPRPEEIAIAQANLKAAQARLAQVSTPRPEKVAIAKANLEGAEAQLSELLAGATQHQIAAAEAALARAKNNLYYQQAVRDAYDNRSPVFYTKEQGEALVGVAYEDVRAAQANLDGLKAPPKPDRVKQLEASVEVAKQQLSLVETPATAEELAELQAAVEAAQGKCALAKAPYTARDLEIAQARVKQARATVEQAKVALKNTVLTAPYAGTVVDILVKPGEAVLAGTPVVILADLSRLRVETKDLEEGNVGSLILGQRVLVKVNAFENKVLSGKVTDLALQATLTSAGDANFKVTITLDQQDPALRWGMTTKVEFLPP